MSSDKSRIDTTPIRVVWRDTRSTRYYAKVEASRGASREMWLHATTWTDGYAEAERHARVQAFGAIRRAAEVARKAEDYREGHYDPELDRMFEGLFCNHDRDPLVVAEGIRRAIRAAIGSEKAADRTSTDESV